MPHSFGLRARTRKLFSQPFRRKGQVHLSSYLTTYKLGDYVDIRGNGSVHRGLPHKFYHGRTGRVWNVTKRAVGVEILKRVGNRYMRKRINVRTEHVRKSSCRADFLKRVRENERLKAEAKEKGVKIRLKRQPIQPKAGGHVKAKIHKVETLAPLPYEILI
eukprot:TRINITY_DN1445_c0_g1_i1.p1 TRINITY_DN1445_c0_g1~~TRINITY_DN1445_c0_g1_i1.p1  ORF type:complete len:161 (+),score=61.81 TRINITY_DN1445_c0_g1_i1:87-569(+)